MTEDEAKQLAEAHWEWLEKILLQQLEVQHRLFVDAMVHGIKHERDYLVGKVVAPQGKEV